MLTGWADLLIPVAIKESVVWRAIHLFLLVQYKEKKNSQMKLVGPWCKLEWSYPDGKGDWGTECSEGVTPFISLSGSNGCACAYECALLKDRGEKTLLQSQTMMSTLVYCLGLFLPCLKGRCNHPITHQKERLHFLSYFLFSSNPPLGHFCDGQALLMQCNTTTRLV